MPLIGAAVAALTVWMAYHLGYTSGYAAGREAGFGDGKKAGTKEGAAKGFAVGYDRGKHARTASDEMGDPGPERNSPGISWGVAVMIAAIVVVFFMAVQTRRGAPKSTLPSRTGSATFPIGGPTSIVP